MRKKAEKVVPVELLSLNNVDERLSARIEILKDLVRDVQTSYENKSAAKKLIEKSEKPSKSQKKDKVDKEKLKLIQEIDKTFPEVLSNLNTRMIKKEYDDYMKAKAAATAKNQAAIGGKYLSLRENMTLFLADKTITNPNRMEILKLYVESEMKPGRAKSTVEQKPIRIKTSEGQYSTDAPVESPATSPMPMNSLESPRGENLSPRGEEGHSNAPKIQAEESALKPLQESQEYSPQYLELEESAKHCHESKEMLDQFVSKAADYILDNPDATRANMEVNVLVLQNKKIKSPAQLSETISDAVNTLDGLTKIVSASLTYFMQCESHAKESDLREHSLFHAQNPFLNEKNTIVQMADDYIIKNKDSIQAFRHVVEVFTALAGGKISKLRSSELISEIEKDVKDAGYDVKRLEDPGKK